MYTGVTNNLLKRMEEHKLKVVPGFTKRYRINKLAYFEEYSDIKDALNREKQIKGGSRQKKLELIRSINSHFEDLSTKLFE